MCGYSGPLPLPPPPPPLPLSRVLPADSHQSVIDRSLQSPHPPPPRALCDPIQTITPYVSTHNNTLTHTSPCPAGPLVTCAMSSCPHVPMSLCRLVHPCIPTPDPASLDRAPCGRPRLSLPDAASCSYRPAEGAGEWQWEWGGGGGGGGG